MNLRGDPPGTSPLNAFSIDLEFWYMAELMKRHAPAAPLDFLMESVEPIIDLLHKTGTRATFFVVGALAEKYPDLIREIHERGHEIACHGYSHSRLHELGEQGFRL